VLSRLCGLTAGGHQGAGGEQSKGGGMNGGYIPRKRNRCEFDILCHNLSSFGRRAIGMS